MNTLLLALLCECPVALPGDNTWTADQLLRMSQNELLMLFQMAGVSEVPRGFARGQAIIKPGSRRTILLSRSIRLLWKGKEFKDGETMVNRLALGLRAVSADVYLADSWLDGQPTLVLDYSQTSKLFAHVRDEVRQISPGLYLGITYVRRPDGPKLALLFTLETYDYPNSSPSK